MGAPTHRGFGTRLYRIFGKMKDRCYNAAAHNYHLYGGRGIKICDEWRRDFSAFRKWALEHGYSDELSIDRIDVNGDYIPTNCRWLNKKSQANNRRSNQTLTIDGETHNITEWASIKDIPMKTLHARIKRGWVGNELFLPVDIHNPAISTRRRELTV